MPTSHRIALSPTVHWAFDVGLLTVTDDYKVKASPQLAKGQNSPQHLAELAGTRILLPKEESFHPDRESLRGLREKVFRGAVEDRLSPRVRNLREVGETPLLMLYSSLNTFSYT
jgi:hypothetical protein